MTFVSCQRLFSRLLTRVFLSSSVLFLALVNLADGYILEQCLRASVRVRADFRLASSSELELNFCLAWPGTVEMRSAPRARLHIAEHPGSRNFLVKRFWLYK